VLSISKSEADESLFSDVITVLLTLLCGPWWESLELGIATLCLSIKCSDYTARGESGFGSEKAKLKKQEGRDQIWMTKFSIS